MAAAAPPPPAGVLGPAGRQLVEGRGVWSRGGEGWGKGGGGRERDGGCRDRGVVGARAQRSCRLAQRRRI